MGFTISTIYLVDFDGCLGSQRLLDLVMLTKNAVGVIHELPLQRFLRA